MVYCSRCHDVLMMSINLNDIAILNINGADYLCIINGISKNESLNLPMNRKKGIIKIKKNYKNLSPCIKWVKKL